MVLFTNNSGLLNSSIIKHDLINDNIMIFGQIGLSNKILVSWRWEVAELVPWLGGGPAARFWLSVARMRPRRYIGNVTTCQDIPINLTIHGNTPVHGPSVTA